MTGVRTSDGFMLYPIVALDEPDYEAWAKAHCARKGWEFVQLVSQHRVGPKSVQLHVKAVARKRVTA